MNILNLDAESGANMIGDDSQPTLEITNSGGGIGLDVKGLALTSTASIDVANIAALKGATSRPVAAANATVVSFSFTGSSIASGAVFAFLNNSAFVSTATIKANTAVAANTGAIRIVKPNGTFGWIPVYDDGDVTAVAV